jgi:hypothetical protein
MKNSIAALVPWIVLGFTANTAYAKDPALLALTMEHFRDTATVKDDPVDAITTISTENGYAEHKGPMRMVWNDEYLRSVIDKKTGQKSFQVYAWIIYGGRLRSYETADYQTPAGPKSVPAIQIGKEMANCAVGECLYTERRGLAASARGSECSRQTDDLGLQVHREDRSRLRGRTVERRDRRIAGQDR